MKEGGSLLDWREYGVEWLAGERTIGRKVATVRGQDFRVRREVGERDDGRVGQSRFEVGIFFEPEQKVSGIEPYVEIGSEIAIDDHLEQGFRVSYRVGGLGQNRRAQRKQIGISS